MTVNKSDNLNSEKVISKLAIGTAQFGLDYGISNENGIVSELHVAKILKIASDHNIDTIDTAKVYGSSEKSIGIALKKQSHKKWNIITKITNNEENIISQIQDSSNKLSILPSIILAHSADLFLNENFQDELALARQKLMVKKVGVSIYFENEIKNILDSPFTPDVIQLPMNILDTRLYRSGILALLYEKNIEIHVRSVFLQGLFYLDDRTINEKFNDAKNAIIRLKSIAKNAGLTLAEFSLLWVVSLIETSKVIVGIENERQLKNHMSTLKKKVNHDAFKEALKIRYENKVLLNPLSWI